MSTVWVVRIGYNIKVFESELAARRHFDKERHWYMDCEIVEHVLIK